MPDINEIHDINLPSPFKERAYDVNNDEWVNLTIDRVRIQVRSDDPAKGFDSKVKLGPYWIYLCPLRESEI